MWGLLIGRMYGRFAKIGGVMRVLLLPVYLCPVAPVMGIEGRFNGFFPPSPNGPALSGPFWFGAIRYLRK